MTWLYEPIHHVKSRHLGLCGKTLITQHMDIQLDTLQASPGCEGCLSLFRRGGGEGGGPPGRDGGHPAHQAVGGGHAAPLPGQRQHGLALPQPGTRRPAQRARAAHTLHTSLLQHTHG